MLNFRNANTGITADAQGNFVTALGGLYKELDNSGNAVPPLVFLQVIHELCNRKVFRQLFPQFAEQDRGGYCQQDAEEAWGQIVQVLNEKVPGLNAKKEIDPSKKFVEQFMTVDTIST
jgi:ubiquitin carboxyl-terminal hydrolase 14